MISSALFKGVESSIAVRVAAFIGIPIGNRGYRVVGILYPLAPGFIENIVFVPIGACFLGRCLRSIARLIVEFHILNIDGSERAVLFGRCNCCNTSNIHRLSVQIHTNILLLNRPTIYSNSGFAAEGISILWLQHKEIYIFFPAFKFRDGRKRTVCSVVGIPGGNGFVAFELLPAFISDFIFIGIGIIYLGGCLWGITRLIVEFHILDRCRSDGSRR